ncbi:unknown [Firmicutes bacterium CAG:137]|nr:unknown [Firmicutes bacterium CAG:137]
MDVKVNSLQGNLPVAEIQVGIGLEYHWFFIFFILIHQEEQSGVIPGLQACGLPLKVRHSRCTLAGKHAAAHRLILLVNGFICPLVDDHHLVATGEAHIVDRYPQKHGLTHYHALAIGPVVGNEIVTRRLRHGHSPRRNSLLQDLNPLNPLLRPAGSTDHTSQGQRQRQRQHGRNDFFQHLYGSFPDLHPKKQGQHPPPLLFRVSKTILIIAHISAVDKLISRNWQNIATHLAASSHSSQYKP